MTFLLPNLLASSIVIFILVPKQSSFGTLIFLDSREDSLGTPRSFLDLGFDQRSYPLFPRDVRLRLGGGHAMSPAHTTTIYTYMCQGYSLLYIIIIRDKVQICLCSFLKGTGLTSLFFLVQK